MQAEKNYADTKEEIRLEKERLEMVKIEVERLETERLERMMLIQTAKSEQERLESIKQEQEKRECVQKEALEIQKLRLEEMQQEIQQRDIILIGKMEHLVAQEKAVLKRNEYLNERENAIEAQQSELMRLREQTQAESGKAQEMFQHAQKMQQEIQNEVERIVAIRLSGLQLHCESKKPNLMEQVSMFPTANRDIKTGLVCEQQIPSIDTQSAPMETVIISDRLHVRLPPGSAYAVSELATLRKVHQV